MARSKVRWKTNIEGFAALRNHPTLVEAMASAAQSVAAGTPFDVEVEVWPHEGRRAGPRTSVQIWARSFDARRRANQDPSALPAALGRVLL